jgi:hypothetical protein
MERRWVAFDDDPQEFASCHFDSCSLEASPDLGEPSPDLWPPEFVSNAKAPDWGVGRVLERHAASTVAFFEVVGRKNVQNNALHPFPAESVPEDSFLRLPISVLSRSTV